MWQAFFEKEKDLFRAQITLLCRLLGSQMAKFGKINEFSFIFMILWLFRALFLGQKALQIIFFKATGHPRNCLVTFDNLDTLVNN